MQKTEFDLRKENAELKEQKNYLTSQLMIKEHTIEQYDKDIKEKQKEINDLKIKVEKLTNKLSTTIEEHRKELAKLRR